ncbi:MAG: DNA mismatch repair protein MutL [Candidatus Electronema aureum]|uniref:DNA mismatch repair protein MutL n=1 Tax=Candidatus Electronema aureum TaxID=2005002 RepID=A0A521FZX4_9BACT|nr:MAG: DNA mismatch repair protein MutL [Candidatus Electronema aureum]
MSKIRILSDQLASRIAAGEVVERPASAVKELLENALDAGASRIEIQVEDDGTRLIRVADNGCGMDQDDVLLCLERHATSKLTEKSQLDAIATLGFRGEALPSIASVSRLTILSRTHEATSGTRAEVRCGILHDLHEDGCACGTIVEIRNLFANIPARRKFLKSKRTELAHIEEVIRSQALAYPEVSFSLHIDERKTLDLPAASPEQRLRDVFRWPEEKLLVIEASGGSLAVYGWLLPSGTTVGLLRICVNRRPVQDRMLRHAVAEGMQSLLMKGQQPAGGLLLKLSPELADINVHPAKREIRFRNSGEVHQAVVKAVVEAVRQQQGQLRSQLFAVPKQMEPVAPPVFHETSCMTAPALSGCCDVGAKNFSPLQVRLPQGVCVAEPQPQFREQFAKLPEMRPLLLEPKRGGLRLIGQLLNLYLLCEHEGQLVVIDQHAAHERIIYQQLRENYEQRQPVSQTLLFPVTVELKPEHADILEKKGEMISALGLEAEFFGGSTWIIKTLPALAAHLPPQEILLEIIDGLSSSVPEHVNKMLAALACKAAVKAGNRLQPEEMLKLLEQMGECTTFSHCPHGRPVLKFFSQQEMEKWFKRGG